MKAVKALSLLITLLLTFPISVYLQFLILSHIQATDMMWFLFIIYWPLVTIATTINAIVLVLADKK